MLSLSNDATIDAFSLSFVNPSSRAGLRPVRELDRPISSRYAGVMPVKSKTGASRTAREPKAPAPSRKRRNKPSGPTPRVAAPQQVEVLPARKPGRPPREFDPEAGSDIIAYVLKGLPLRLAVKGVCSVEVCHRWMAENPQFAQEIDLAARESSARTLDALNDAPAGVWQKHAWKLERVHGLNPKTEVAVENTHKLEVSSGVCSQLAEAWQAFESQIERKSAGLKRQATTKPLPSGQVQDQLP
jgi:hypothetical protein